MEDNIKMKILNEVKDNINNGDIKKPKFYLKDILILIMIQKSLVSLLTYTQEEEI